MRWLPALFMALLLAGCSWPEPRAPEGAEPTVEAAVTPSVGRWLDRCLWPDIEAASAAADGVTASDGLAFEVRIRATCADAHLAPSGLCPGELFTVELRTREDAVLGALRDGAVYPLSAPCPTADARAPVHVPQGFVLSQASGWNGTVAQPCRGAIFECWTFGAPPAGTYRLSMWIREASGAATPASFGFRFGELCAQVELVLEDPEGAPREPDDPDEPRVVLDHRGRWTLGIDNETFPMLVLTSFEGTRGWVSWCGDRGEHRVRVESPDGHPAEQAVLAFEREHILLRLSPLRVEPLPAG